MSILFTVKYSIVPIVILKELIWKYYFFFFFFFFLSDAVINLHICVNYVFIAIEINGNSSKKYLFTELSLINKITLYYIEEITIAIIFAGNYRLSR